MNKKGITLVEIIISIVLISIVLIFLFSLLITVNDINKESEVNSTYLINKSLILKNIEEDLDNAETINISNCSDMKELYSKYGYDLVDDTESFSKEDGNEKSELKANRCLNFKFNKDTSEESNAYLGIYYYKSKNSYVISYIHDEVKSTRLLPNYELNSKNIERDSNNIITTWTLNGIPISSNTLYRDEFYIINIPIIGSDGKDYSINISYYKNS